MHYTQMIQKPITVQTKSKPIHYPVLIFQKKKTYYPVFKFHTALEICIWNKKRKQICKTRNIPRQCGSLLAFPFSYCFSLKKPKYDLFLHNFKFPDKPRNFFFFSLFLTFLTQKANTSLQFFPLNFQILCPPPFSLSASFI